LDSLEKNAGMIARRIKKPFQLYGRLHTDISFQNRYIINNVDMVLRLIRYQSSFCLTLIQRCLKKVKILVFIFGYKNFYIAIFWIFIFIVANCGYKYK
jgi:hypothetical protein